jgi:hypothetical protein
MRRLLAVLVIAIAGVFGVAVFLISTTPKRNSPIRFPLSESQAALLRHVPASADAFALIPTAVAVHAKLSANPMTSEALLQWEEQHEMPRPWMLGGADVALWKSGKKTSYVVRLDPFRAFVVRAWLAVAGSGVARWEASTLIVNDPEPATAPSADLDALLRIARGLPEGDAFVVQRTRERGAFPPIERPAVTSVRISNSEIVIVSRAETTEAPPPMPVLARFPRGAIFSATFAEPHRTLGDLSRLVGVKVKDLVEHGGQVVFYDVDTGTLLPRPRGLIVLPATDESRAALEDVRRIAELVGEIRATPGELDLSFDRTSLGLYARDSFVPAPWPVNRWAIRMDPVRLVPILRKVADNRGLQFLTPNVHRAARDLRKWIGALEHAQSIEAGASVLHGVEELRVRIAAK